MLRTLFFDPPYGRGATTRVARAIGVGIVLILAITGFVVGSQTYLRNQSSAEFYQPLFDVAVSIACTGHIDRVIGNQDVDAFLMDRMGSLTSCDGVDAARSANWTSFNMASLYLYLLAAVAWMWLGISWSSLSLVAGVFGAGFAVGAYWFVRSFSAGRAIALALAFAALFAPPVIDQIPNLRDFSKAPLILLGLGLIGRTLFSRPSFLATTIRVLGVGAMAGLGRGLRPDALILLPIAIAAFAFLWPNDDGWRRRFKGTLGAVIALFVGYLVASAPVTIVNASKTDTAGLGAHVFILGLAEQFYDSLGFERGNYAVLRDYVDEEVQVLVNLHATGIGAALIDQRTSDYGPPSSDLFMDLLAMTPHDAFMRIFATANRLGAYPLNNLVYGPILILLLAAGLVLLPKPTTFYCIAAAVIVPVLSLQFHPRHAFYIVVLGAAALGLAYTLVAMTSATLLNPSSGVLPNRRTAMRRVAGFGASAVAMVAAGCAFDYATREQQDRALVRLHETYRNAEWTPIELARQPVEITFPSLASSDASKVGVMAVSFALHDRPDPTTGIIGDLDWRAFGDARLVSTGEGFQITTNRLTGYQFESRSIDVSEFDVPSDDASEQRVVSLHIRGRAQTGWMIGVLSHDDTRWIDNAPIPAGSFDRRITLRIPREEPAVHLVWVRTEPGATVLELSAFAATNASALSSCKPGPWNITPLHRYGNSRGIGTPVAIPSAESGTYYFPFAQANVWSLVSVNIDGVPTRCIDEARVASSLPAHTAPIELFETDGEFQPTHRLAWKAVLEDFARLHRHAR